jgi:hypothetical protein
VEAEGLRAIRRKEPKTGALDDQTRQEQQINNNNTFLTYHVPFCQIDVHRATPSRHQPPDPFIRSTTELGHIASLLLLPVASSKPLLRQFSLPRSTAAVLIATHAQPDSPISLSTNFTVTRRSNLFPRNIANQGLRHGHRLSLTRLP